MDAKYHTKTPPIPAMVLVEICWMHAQYPLKLLEDVNGCASPNMLQSYDLFLVLYYFIILYYT